MLNCEQQSNWKNINEALCLGQFFGSQNQDDHEKWSFFNVCDYKLPSDEELRHLKAIIIPGSSASACNNEKLSWITNFQRFIVKVYTEYPQIKILGICFGSQIVAAALGGKVERMNRKMFIGKEIINFTPIYQKLTYIKKAIQQCTQDKSESFAEQVLISLKEQVILSTHNDHVTSLPPQAEILSFSKTCPIEHWIIGHQVLCMQAHPEFSFTLV